MSAQYTLNFEPALPERWATLRQFVAHRSGMVHKPPKVQAADMDLAPSTLSRKLNPHEGDTQRLNCDDLESWLASTGDAAAIVEYLAAKFLQPEDARRARVLTQAEHLIAELQRTLPLLKGAA